MTKKPKTKTRAITAVLSEDRILKLSNEGEKVAFTDDPRSNGGNVVLVMGIPITEITGPEADAILGEEIKQAALRKEAQEYLDGMKPSKRRKSRLDKVREGRVFQFNAKPKLKSKRPA